MKMLYKRRRARLAQRVR